MLTLYPHPHTIIQVGHIPESTSRARQLLWLRLWLLVVYSIVLFPGGLALLPMYLLSKNVSEKKKKEALAGSIVKLEGI